MLKIILLFLVWCHLVQAKEDLYLKDLADQYPYVRQLAMPPLSQWPNHDLGGFVINWEGANGIARAIMQNHDLKSLGFRHCELSALTAKPILLSLVNHPSIEKIDLGFNPLGKAGHKLLIKLIQNNATIHTLDIAHTSCVFDEVADLWEAVWNSHVLKEVIFDLNVFQKEAAEKLGELKEPNRTIEKLSFSFASFSPRALEEFACHVHRLPSLKSLDLSMNFLRDDNAITLANIASKCPNLEEIIFSKNETTYNFIFLFEKYWTSLAPERRKRDQKSLVIYLSRPSKDGVPLRGGYTITSGPRPVKII